MNIICEIILILGSYFFIMLIGLVCGIWDIVKKEKYAMKIHDWIKRIEERKKRNKV